MDINLAGEPARELALTRRALDILLAIDAARDAARGPTAIFAGVVRAVTQQFQADLCHLYLVDGETDRLELKTVHELKENAGLRDWALSRGLARRALNTEGVRLWALDGDPVDTQESAPLITVPVFMAGSPLGALVLGRGQPPFAQDDIALLQIAENEIDSAVIQAHTHQELTNRNKELETIYRFDRIRDADLPFDEMLQTVLHELCAVIRVDTGFVMLYDRRGNRLELRAQTHEDLSHNPALSRLIQAASQEAVDRAELVHRHKEEGRGYHLICVPLILRDEIIGVFGAVNRDGQRRFSENDRRLLMAIVSQMDTAILENIERRRLRRVLGRSVDPRVLSRLLASPNVDLLMGERTHLTVLYADLRGSTGLSTRLSPSLLVDFINDYLGKMTEVVLAREGTLDKFVGDEVMAIFGAPLVQEDHQARAVQVGLEMQKAHQTIVGSWARRGISTAGLGIGIATGELIVGEFGCEQRTDYTVIGPAANLGARICGAAEAGQVLVSTATYEAVQDRVVARPHRRRFKGFNGDTTVYEIMRMRPEEVL